MTNSPVTILNYIPENLHNDIKQGICTVDLTSYFNDALTDSKSVYIPSGKYYITHLTLFSGIKLYGDGYFTELYISGIGSNHVFFGNSINGFTLSEFRISGNQNLNLSMGSGIRLEGACTNGLIQNLYVNDCKFDGISIACSGGSQIKVLSSVSTNNGAYGFYISDSPNSVIENCVFSNNGNNGCLVLGALVKITNNYAEANGESGFVAGGGADTDGLVYAESIVFGSNTAKSNAKHGFQMYHALRSIYTSNFSQSNGLSGFDRYKSAYCQSSNNIAFQNLLRGYEIDSRSFYSICSGDSAIQNGENGFNVFNSAGTALIGCQALENNTVSTNPGIEGWNPVAGIRIYDDLLGAGANIRIVGCQSIDARGTEATQKFGIQTDATISGVTIESCVVTPNKLAPTKLAASTIINAHSNQGLRTVNSGTSTILNGNTSIAVSHQLDIQPVLADIQVTPESDLGTASKFWISNASNTNFVININIPNSADISFSWSVNIKTITT